MSNEVKFKYGDASAYAAKLATEGGVDASALYFVSKDISTYDGVDFGGTIYRGNDALGTTCADHLKTVEAIQIAGGPFANNVVESNEVWPWKDEGGNKIIPAGKSIQEILSAMFLKVVNGTVVWGNASWTPSISDPTVRLSSNGPVEVNSKVKVSTLTAGSVSAGTRSAICACSQGHFLADESGNPTGSHISGNKTVLVNGSITGTAALSCKWNNVATDITVNSTELTVTEGSNKIEVTQSGQVATVAALPAVKVFAATNTKQVLADTSAVLNDSKPADVSLVDSSTDTINAYYPIYTNGKQGSNGVASNETTLVADDATKLALVADNTAFYVNFAPMIDGGTGYRLVIQKDKTITEAMALNTLNSKYEVDMKSSFVKAAGTVTKKSGNVDTEYVVYEAKGSAGANALRIKID